MEEIGTGVLDWDREERISDRYGTVMLFKKARPHQDPIPLPRRCAGAHGRLIAVVRNVHETSHLGDLFHKVYPVKPSVGDSFVLGEGTLFFADDAVGVMPADGRKTLWLDIQALYCVHNQTVVLFFEEQDA